MTQVTFQGDNVNVSGSIPTPKQVAPDFSLTSSDLSEFTLSNFSGMNLIISIFPSVDTPVCADSVKRFSEEVSKLDDTQVICISADLPFAVSRFLEIEKIENVLHASTFRSPDFAESYGVAIADGALLGLTTRAVVCVDKKGVVVHSELVEEITNEPNYDAAISALS